MANITKIQAFTAMAAMPENAEYKDILEAEIVALGKRAEAAKKYKIKKNTAIEGEKEIILGLLSTEPKTVNDVLAEVEGTIDGITKNKVIARLTSLVNEGKAEKFDVKDEDKKTRKAYALPGSYAAAEA